MGVLLHCSDVLVTCYVDFAFLKIYRQQIKAKYQPNKMFVVCLANKTVYTIRNYMHNLFTYKN